MCGNISGIGVVQLVQNWDDWLGGNIQRINSLIIISHQMPKPTVRTLSNELPRLLYRLHLYLLKVVIPSCQQVYTKRIRPFAKSKSLKVILILAFILALIYRRKRNNGPPSPPKKTKQLPAKFKKSISQLSLKHYESQSEKSDNCDSSDNEDYKPSMVKINTKYCTDVETDPYNTQNSGKHEHSTDRLFFDMLRQYQQQPDEDQLSDDHNQYLIENDINQQCCEN